jgi:hypothetical protein
MSPTPSFKGVPPAFRPGRAIRSISSGFALRGFSFYPSRALARFSKGSLPLMKTKLVSTRPRPRITEAAARAKASPAPEPVPIWTGRIQIQATPEVAEFLYRQGARPDRGGRTFGLSNVMRQQLALFLAVIEESDPRTRKNRPPFPQDYYDLTIEVLAQPSTVNADLIRLLDGYIARQAHLPSLLEERGVERSAYLHAVAELDFAERLHLVEKALVRHAPTPPKLPSRRRR